MDIFRRGIIPFVCSLCEQICNNFPHRQLSPASLFDRNHTRYVTNIICSRVLHLYATKLSTYAAWYYRCANFVANTKKSVILINFLTADLWNFNEQYTNIIYIIYIYNIFNIIYKLRIY